MRSSRPLAPQLDVGRPQLPALQIHRWQHPSLRILVVREQADPANGNLRRAIYRHIVRSQSVPFLDAFDCPDSSVMAPKRSQTTTPLQALSLLNNEFVSLEERALRRAIAPRGGQRCRGPGAAPCGWSLAERRPRPRSSAWPDLFAGRDSSDSGACFGTRTSFCMSTNFVG